MVSLLVFVIVKKREGEQIRLGGSFCNHRYFSFRLFCMSDDIGGSFIN